MGIYNNKGWLLQGAHQADGTSLSVPYDGNGDAVPFEVFRAVANVFELPAYTTSGIFQGGCTDGEYIYQICFDNSQYKTGRFIKYKISDGSVTTKSFDASIPYTHGNDMAYNPNNGHLYVAAMSADGAIMELDTDFNYITTHYVVGKNGNPYAVWALCFDRITNRFYSENGDDEAIYDENLNYIGFAEAPTRPSATAQGQETDGKYIYRVFYNPNTIEVSTIDGEFVRSISLPITGEPETLMYNWGNGDYYVPTNSSTTRFYEVELKEPPYPNI